MSKQLAQVAEGKRIGLVIVLAVLLAALAAVGSPMWSPAAHAQTPATTLCPGLYHVNPDGTLATGTAGADCTPASSGTNGNFDVDNNVIGATHEVCAINTDQLNNFPIGAEPFNTSFGPNNSGPFTYYFNVVGLGAGNTPAPLNGTILSTSNNDVNFGTFDAPTSIVCATWTSTQPGDQNVTLNASVNNNPILGAGGTADCSGNGLPEAGQTACTPLIKEWNVLAPTTITTTPPTSPSATAPSTTGTLTNGTTTGTLTFNPDHSTYDGTSATFYENVWGTHTPNQGTQAWYLVAGATVTFTNTSTGVGGCGNIVIGNGVNTNGVVTSENNSFIHVSGGWLAGDPNNGNYEIDPNDNSSVTVTSVGVPIPFHFVSGDFEQNPCTQSLGSNSSVSITVSYPSAVGSQNPTFPAETLQVNWANAPQQTKQVLLAWVGQRIIVEHDWRVPPGDASDLTPAGACAFGAYNSGGEGGGDAYIEYDKQDGPGGFIGGLQNDTYFSGGGATTVVDMYVDDNPPNSQADTVPDSPQSACISRALFESDAQGQVDITAYQVRSGSDGYTRTDNQSTMAWVVYYMNLNTVDTTVVSAAKPTHNSSLNPDWTPANPWDASAETATTTSNISKDVLVRGRVTGWFTNDIPSGRAADSANHLPADRWVMPDDWATLAGGANSSFRPSFDLMFSPTNTGMALTSPQGNGSLTQVAVALTGSGTGALPNNSTTAPTAASPILVANASSLYVGESIYIGASTTPHQIVLISPVAGVGSAIFISPTVVAPVAGTPIYIAGSGVPFEGPYSLIDIQGLAVNNNGIAGAALSNIAGTANSATRDTTQGDGTVDWWDAPMPPANISVAIRGTGFIKQVIKSDVYYLGTANTTAQTYPNPYYISNIPGSPFIPAAVAGSHYLWDSWGPDGPAADGGAASSVSNGLAGQGPYAFWTAVPTLIGQTSAGVWGDPLTNPSNALNAKRVTELNDIRADYGDATIARDLVVFSDNHGEFMVAANGDFLPDYTACATNSLGGGHQCKPGDAVGTGTVTAVADYPDFVGQSIGPVASNATTINWTWGGYKSVTIEKDPAGNTQYVYIVFHAIDRDGHCSNGDGAVLLHPVLTALDTGTGADTSIGNQVETVDFKIDAGDGIVLGTSGGGTLNDGSRFATGVPTYSLAASKAGVTGVTTVNFPMDASLAASGQTDECQAWIKVSNSLLNTTNVLTIAHDDEGNIGFDQLVTFQTTQNYTLNFRWTLFTWAGADNIPVTDALAGGADTLNPKGNDISDQVTAVYGWQPDSQTWLGYFPSGADIPGANNLTTFHTGEAYWIAIKGPGSVTWTITTNVS